MQYRNYRKYKRFLKFVKKNIEQLIIQDII